MPELGVDFPDDALVTGVETTTFDDGGTKKDISINQIVAFAASTGLVGASDWREGVANIAALPPSGNTVGHIRFALAEAALVYWDGDSWESIGGGGASNPIQLTPTANTAAITLDTADGSDDARLVLAGGGGGLGVDAGRSSQIHLFGNEYGGTGGYAQYFLGSVAGALHQFYDKDVVERLRIGDSGVVVPTGSLNLLNGPLNVQSNSAIANTFELQGGSDSGVDDALGLRKTSGTPVAGYGSGVTAYLYNGSATNIVMQESWELFGGTLADTIWKLGLRADGVQKTFLQVDAKAGTSEQVFFRTRTETVLTDAGTTDVQGVSKITRRTTGTAAVGFGLQQRWVLENDGNSETTAAQLIVKWDSAILINEDANVRFETNIGGTLADRWAIYDDGGDTPVFELFQKVRITTGGLTLTSDDLSVASGRIIQVESGTPGSNFFEHTNVASADATVSTIMEYRRTGADTAPTSGYGIRHVWNIHDATASTNLQAQQDVSILGASAGDDTKWNLALRSSAALKDFLTFNTFTGTTSLYSHGGTNSNLELVDSDSATSTVKTTHLFRRRSTGTVAAGYGQQIIFGLEASSGADNIACLLKMSWDDAGLFSADANVRFQTNIGGSTSDRWAIYDAGSDVPVMEFMQRSLLTVSPSSGVIPFVTFNGNAQTDLSGNITSMTVATVKGYVRANAVGLSGDGWLAIYDDPTA